MKFPGRPVLVLNPPVREPGLALAAQAAGAVGLVDPATTDPAGAAAVLVRDATPVPSTARIVLLTTGDAALAERLRAEGRTVLAVAAAPADCPAAHAIVARADTPAATVAAVKALAGPRPVLAWGPLDRAGLARARAAGAAGFVVDAAFWALPESPLDATAKAALATSPGAARLAPFIARRSGTLARALDDLLADAAAEPPAPAPAPAPSVSPPPARSAAPALRSPSPSPPFAVSAPSAPSENAAPSGNSAAAHPAVAIVGMGCVFPGAPDLASYRDLLLTGRSAIREVDPARWDPAHFYHPDPKAPDKTYSKIGGFVDDLPFPAAEFRMPPAVARSLDGLQKMALIAARAALQDAGLAPLAGAPGRDFDRTRCAVILGNSLGGESMHTTDRRIYWAEVRAHLSASLPAAELDRLEAEYKARFPAINEDTMPGELGNVTAGRIANVFNLGGKNHTTDAACASSLAAIDTAVAALSAGEVDLVLCGGADRSMDAAGYVKFSKIGALSATASRPFDAEADGFVQGEGAGILVLKRLADAARDGDRIYAVVRAVGASSDGRGKGITAPNPEGQKAAVRRALAAAQLSPHQIQAVECHGTGTAVGDVVELESLAAVFGDLPPGSIPVGSVKSQIGHLKSAAGAAALIKSALALHEGVLPPTINVRTPNPKIAWDRIPFRPHTQAGPLPPAPPGEPPRIGVSAFGFGGTNFHVILEGYRPDYHATPASPARVPAPARSAHSESPPAPPSPVLVLGADAPQGLAPEAARVRAHLAREPREAAAARGRARALRAPVRVAVAGDAEALDLLRPGADPRTLALKGVFVGQGRCGKVAFLFPGQGSQYAGMLKDLPHPIVQGTFAEADRILAPLLGAPLTSFLDDEAALTRTEITQPAVLAADVALLRMLAAWGVQPDIVAGHSLGEYAALVAAGVLRFEDALVAVSARGSAMANVKVEDKGRMAAVQADAARVEAILKGIDGYVVPANKNSPEQVVIAGATAAVEKAVERLTAEGLPCAMLPVSAAFHSAIVAPASEPLRQVLGGLSVSAPRVPVIANVHAEPYPADPDAIRDLLARQVASPVEWQATVERLRREGVTVFVEIGPKRVLSGLAERILTGHEVVITPTNHPKKGGPRSLDEAVARLAAAGVPIALPDAPDADPAPPAPPLAPDPPLAPALALAPALPIVVSGTALGLPGRAHRVFDDANAQRLLRGDTGIDRLGPAEEQAILDKRVVRLVKDGGEPRMEAVKDRSEVIHLAGRRGAFDLAAEFGLDPKHVETWDTTTRLAVAAAIDALRDAGIPLVREQRVVSSGRTLPGGWVLPEAMRGETGIIFASAFPGYDNLLAAVEADRRGEAFDRKFLFKVLSFGHAELAELIRARGPCTQVNAACASTTQALAIAQDWIRAGRCRRVLVVGADDVTSDRMLPWIGAGFLASGAATTAETVQEGALPFDRRRNGMIIGMGAVGLVVESEEACRERGVEPAARLLATRVANSAHHGSRLDVEHIAGEVEAVVEEAARAARVPRAAMGRQSLFVSHETYTPARGGSAAAEVAALRRAFGEATRDVVVVNVKGYTGHPMGAGLEDALAVKALEHDLAPPVPNLREPDEGFADLNFSRGGPHGRRFALRLSAGFGSQLALAVFEQAGRAGARIDAARHAAWLARITNLPAPRLEVVNRTLRVAESSGTILPAPRPTPAPALAHGPPLAPALAPTVSSAPSGHAAPSATPEAVRDRVLTLVAERTGYTREQLDLDLDMEADLGIDTVKQAELLGALREAYALPREEGLRIKDYPTLRAVIAYVSTRAAGATPPPSPPAPAPPSPAAPALPSAAPPPPPAPVPSVAARPEAEVLALLTAVTAEKSGYPAEALDPTLDLEADLGIDTVKQAEIFGIVRERLGLARPENLRLKDYPTLAAVAKLLATAAPPPAATPAAGPEATPAPAAGSGVRHLVPRLREAPPTPGTPQPHVLFDARAAPLRDLFERARTAPESLGPHLIVLHRRDDATAGACGLGKALARELKLAVTTVAIDGEAASAVAAEAAHPPPAGQPREVVWQDGRRHLVAEEPSRHAPSTLVVAPGDRIVASGGAQGIAAACLRSVAPHRPRLLLLGRTVLPAAMGDLAGLTDAALAAKREAAAAALKAEGRKATPVAVERAVAPWVKGREIARNVAELSALGATVEYATCDVSDPASVRAVLAAAADAVGLLHAAGVEESRLLADKDAGAWDRTWDPKVGGAEALVESLPNLRWTVLFGSVAGRFGNAGQVDYSAANAALAGLARGLRARGVAATCIDWTAWAETGMATRGSTLKVLAAAGVEPLATEEGVAAFAALAGGPEAEVVVARSLPWTPAEDPFPFHVVERAPDRVVAELLLDAQAAWMRDHAIDGTPVLAGVLTLEAFTRAAAPLLPAGPLEVADAEFLYAIKLLRNQPLVLRIEARREGTDVLCRATTTPPGPRREERLHAQARLRAGAGPLPAAEAAGGMPWQAPPESVYRALFHGPAFQVLAGLDTVGAHALTARAVPAAVPGRDFPAAMAEAGLQALGAWGLAVPGRMALPSAVGRIRWEAAAGPLRLVVTRARLTDRHVVGHVQGLDDSGAVRLDMADVRLIVIGPPERGLEPPAGLRVLPIGDRLACAVSIPQVAADLPRHLALLPAAERARAEALPVQKRRVEYVAGALALAAAGGRRSDAPRDVPPVGATLSHAGDFAVAVPFDAARERAGVDVERVQARDPAFLVEAFAPGERALLTDPVAATRAWCVKEAVLKALGTGLKLDLHALQVTLEPLSVDLGGAAKEAFVAAGGRALDLHEAELDGHRIALAVLRGSGRPEV